ncbi:MAG: efflux RND transporter periplasmic adaptor subunit [Vicinamibacterales bacterium]
MKKALTLLLIAAALGAAGYYGYSRLRPETASLQLVTATVTRGDVVQTIDATGRLEAMTTVQVGSQVSGTIKALHADFNATVRRGQVIAELEPSLFETQVEQARATVVRLQADVERARIQAQDADLKFARARELAGRQLVPTTDLETADVNARAAAAALRAAEAQVVQAQASLNQSQVNLSHTVIRAPIDGVVISRSVDVGQTVAASMQAPTLFEIANDMTRMQVSCNIDESDIGQVEAGQPVSFTVDAYPNETFSGTVQQVRLSPVIESNVVSYVTIVEVPNPNLRLKPGMTATVTVDVARAVDVLRVPASALRFTPTEALFTSLGQSPPTDAGAVSEEARSGSGTSAAPATEAARSPTSDDGRAAFRARLEAMTPDERAAARAARGGRGGFTGPGAGGGTRDAPSSDGESAARGRLWLVENGILQPVPVRLGISNGAFTEVGGPAVTDGAVVATGATQAAVATAPAASSPLFPQFGRGRGAGGGGNQGRQGGQP